MSSSQKHPDPQYLELLMGLAHKWQTTQSSKGMENLLHTAERNIPLPQKPSQRLGKPTKELSHA